MVSDLQSENNIQSNYCHSKFPVKQQNRLVEHNSPEVRATDAWPFTELEDHYMLRSGPIYRNNHLDSTGKLYLLEFQLKLTDTLRGEILPIESLWVI